MLSYDPDAAGQGAAERSSLLLVQEGFRVNVALLPPGDDPDGFIRKQGAAAYMEQIKASRPYLEYLMDRAAQGRDFGDDEVRREFLNRMLPIAAQIPDAAGRDQFADRLAHKARVTEDVVRAEIRKAAVDRRTTLTTRELPSFGQIRAAERGLIWALFHDEDGAREALAQLDSRDFETLLTRRILEVAQSLHESGVEDAPAALLARLSTEEARLVTGIAAEPARARAGGGIGGGTATAPLRARAGRPAARNRGAAVERGERRADGGAGTAEGRTEPGDQSAAHRLTPGP